MSKASSLYRCLSKTIFSPSELLNILNDEICETTSRGMFVTMLIGIYDKNKKELILSNAGHEPPLIYSKDKSFSKFEEAGPPLGIAPKVKFVEKKISFENSSLYICDTIIKGTTCAYSSAIPQSLQGCRRKERRRTRYRQSAHRPEERRAARADENRNIPFY